jgi:S-adenosyl methyltransferase
MAASAASPSLPSSTHHPVEIDTSVAHASRIYDYLLGGTNNFGVDREAAERMAAAFYGGIDVPRADVRANRAFLVRTVRYLTTDAGIRQFLDIGTGIPNDDNVHAVAQQLAPESRIVYVDHDPVVLAHAHKLLRGSPEGRTAYIDGDLRDPKTILGQARATLDFDRPVGLMLVGVLHYLPDSDNPYGIMEQLVEPLPAGSYVALSHLAIDILPDEMLPIADLIDEAERTIQLAFETVVLRTRSDVDRFLIDELDVLEPGLRPLHEWPLTGPQAPPPGKEIPVYAAIARKARDSV